MFVLSAPSCKDEIKNELLQHVKEGRLTGNLDVIFDIWVKNQYWPEDDINSIDSNDGIKEKVTYIKMNIEGAELDTLMGQRK